MSGIKVKSTRALSSEAWEVLFEDGRTVILNKDKSGLVVPDITSTPSELVVPALKAYNTYAGIGPIRN